MDLTRGSAAEGGNDLGLLRGPSGSLGSSAAVDSGKAWRLSEPGFLFQRPKVGGWGSGRAAPILITPQVTSVSLWRGLGGLGPDRHPMDYC